ncbi:MAG: nitrilase/cyanide hydratase and apolipoprotein N-acyltransferase [Ignavibacteria bacterium]|nr:MAG: nitrilase/cyanide hydratase and apolipoprotein N-acyltransferase [Ignavibacteria bacterium]KAF0159894.1 MAG: nitrilase/cyanide hydratase and apolipoprotein N-acyltransferase [Ignavibacteria bacterium]
MKIGLVQLAIEWENPPANIEKINKLVSSLEEKPDLLIFPELTLTGFTMNSSQFAEEIDGASTQYFMSLSDRLKTNILCGVIERDAKEIYNSMIHFNENGLLMARYRKIHPFSFAGEDKNYTASNELVVTEINHLKIGLSICYDLRFPELFRLYAKKDVGLLINIANWPVPRIEHWQTLLKARAIENQCFVIGVNRTGTDPKNYYNGNSVICNPAGKELISIGGEEKIIVQEININEVSETRDSLPFLKDIKLL